MRDKFKGRAKAFKALPNVLREPTVYHFNPRIVESGKGYIRGVHTKIKADFLMFNNNTHLFLRYEDNKFVPVSILYNSTSKYTNKQIEMKVESISSTFRCIKNGQDFNSNAI